MAEQSTFNATNNNINNNNWLVMLWPLSGHMQVWIVKYLLCKINILRNWNWTILFIAMAAKLCALRNMVQMHTNRQTLSQNVKSSRLYINNVILYVHDHDHDSLGIFIHFLCFITIRMRFFFPIHLNIDKCRHLWDGITWMMFFWLTNLTFDKSFFWLEFPLILFI